MRFSKYHHVMQLSSVPLSKIRGFLYEGGWCEALAKSPVVVLLSEMNSFTTVHVIKLVLFCSVCPSQRQNFWWCPSYCLIKILLLPLFVG